MLNDLQDPVLGTGDRYKILNLNQTINDVIHHYERLLNSLYQGYLSIDLPINLVSGQSIYPLPSTFRSPIYEIRRTINDINYYINPVHTYNAVLSTTPVANSQFLPSYHLEGNSLVVSYPPESNETAGLILKHQLKLLNLILDTDQLNDQLYDAEDCVVIKSAIRALKAKDVSGALKNIAGWESELGLAESAFFMQVGNRYVKPDRPIPIQYMSDFF